MSKTNTCGTCFWFMPSDDLEWGYWDSVCGNRHSERHCQVVQDRGTCDKWQNRTEGMAQLAQESCATCCNNMKDYHDPSGMKRKCDCEDRMERPPIISDVPGSACGYYRGIFTGKTLKEDAR